MKIARMEKITQTSDDIAGLQSLYGELKTSLPLGGDYGLNKTDLLGISTEFNLQERDGLNTRAARESQGESIREMYEFVNSGEINRALAWEKIPGYTSGMSFEAYMDLSHNLIKNNLASRTSEELEILRQGLSAGVAVMDDLMGKCSDCNGMPSRSLLEAINQKNSVLRNAVIDVQRSRE